MAKTVIHFENVSKLYQLGEISTGTISRDLSRWWALSRGKSDPVSKIGEVSRKGPDKELWALSDISFEIKQGEVLGIIGGNGAGKSTLLKILSRVTKPTTGRIRIRGRIASLLEVGTGFHPDLTGRENIFLNGAILGMRKNEIQDKLDEIVAFAGVERYLDTPVKRYSSGMYVRLAFAVAAHLEPEILVIDEVLAVGDAEFQRKCIGKMKDVSQNEGRTVLFVSHNLASVKSLCSKSIFLKNGKLEYQGETDLVINQYLNNQTQNQSEFYFEAKENQEAYLTSLKITDHRNQLINSFLNNDLWKLKIGFHANDSIKNLVVAVGILTSDNILLRSVFSNPFQTEMGNYEAVFIENDIVYSAGTYQIIISLSINNHVIQQIEDGIFITFEETQLQHSFIKTKNKGLILNQMKIEILSV
ncbi:polysaccharide ABC transporter ATP-binding protein [Dyadobacter sp. CY356]|uniref:ABC transporter ATP-binding protein n=1 Tax=Dyadobacter sp. CY356 TaxID=2906442 RepID=UPI001F2979A8|nr:polysaccharide ABC transporter ATP-binding protein [Dyadobacter sp. CY356]MCF0056746.1 polysaccharide ABC transporter ATP-binding protein [Dyadobacter sp. CY356]